MTKTEIISRIIDRITDPWTECPEDYEYAELIDLDEAKDVLKQYRYDDVAYDLDPENRMPEEVTPELLMEAFNCNVRHMKFELRVERLAEYITDNEMVCEYDNYYRPEYPDSPEVLPVDFIWDSFPFKPIGDMSPDNPLFLIGLGQRSKTSFNSNHEFCWYDRENNLLHSTDTPFADGILDAEAFARFTLCDAETLGYFLDGIMDDDEIVKVFGCTRDDLLKEVTK